MSGSDDPRVDNARVADTGQAASRAPNQVANREFGCVFAVFFAVVGAWPLLHGGVPRYWAWALAASLLATALVAPGLLDRPARLWSRLGRGLHRITNPLVQALIFYLAVVPTALLMRAVGKDPLRLRLERDSSTYWMTREPPGPSADSMRHPF